MPLTSMHRRCVYAACVLLYASGVAWLVFHYFTGPGNQSGEIRQWLEHWCLEAHGAAAMAFLVVLGSLIPVHVVQASSQRRNMATGLFVLTAGALLIASGWGLYYAGGEIAREWLSIGHWTLGVLGVLLLPLHVIVGRRLNGSKQRQNPAPMLSSRTLSR